MRSKLFRLSDPKLPADEFRVLAKVMHGLAVSTIMTPASSSSRTSRWTLGWSRNVVEYKGHLKTFDATGWWCISCDEAIFEGPELRAAERAFVELRAEVEAVLLPEQIADIREKLQLSQRRGVAAR